MADEDALHRRAYHIERFLVFQIKNLVLKEISQQNDLILFPTLTYHPSSERISSRDIVGDRCGTTRIV